MKKTILSFMVMCCGCAVFAQTGNDSAWHNNNTTNNSMRTSDDMSTSMTSNNAYSAYGLNTVVVPASVDVYLRRDYPNAENVMWQQTGDWYHGIYTNNGRFSHVYYNMAGKTYNLALPVTQTYVPDDVVSKISSKFGPMVYDITTLQGANDQNIYQVRVLENGQLRSEWIGEDGNSINDPYRTGDDEMLNNTMSNGMNQPQSSMNNTMQNSNTSTTSTTTEVKVKAEGDELKIKTKNSDGKETKLKIKDGEIKKKVDD